MELENNRSTSLVLSEEDVINFKTAWCWCASWKIRIWITTNWFWIWTNQTVIGPLTVYTMVILLSYNQKFKDNSVKNPWPFHCLVLCCSWRLEFFLPSRKKLNYIGCVVFIFLAIVFLSVIFNLSKGCDLWFVNPHLQLRRNHQQLLSWPKLSLLSISYLPPLLVD